MEHKSIRLVKVDTKNFSELIRLSPTEAQKNYVASNACSLAEAYAVAAEGRPVFPFGIYAQETPVGFLMIGYDYQDEDEDLEIPHFAKGSYLIWRLMIDKEHQGKGYGREAVRLALEFIRTFPCGKADYCWLSYEPENEPARKLYRSFGFKETEMPAGWDEIPAVLDLRSGPSEPVEKYGFTEDNNMKYKIMPFDEGDAEYIEEKIAEANTSACPRGHNEYQLQKRL